MRVFNQLQQPLLIHLKAAVFIFLLIFSQLGLAQQAQLQEGQERPSQVSEASRSSVEQSNTQQAEETAGNSLNFDVLSAQAWMRRLADTIENGSFELSFVVNTFKRETMPYIWRKAEFENGDEVEQLSLLNGPGFEQIRVNDKVSIFEPGFASISIRSDAIDGPIPNAFLYKPEILNNGYNVLLMGRNRISGRMAQQIRIISKDKSRYQYHLWLDERTGLLLKLNMYDLQGNLLEQIQVTQLNIGNDVREKFVNLSIDELPPFTVPVQQENQQLPWTVNYIPVGMRPIVQNFRRIALNNQPAEYLMLSDGLVDVSVYVMRATDANQQDLGVTSDTRSIVSISDGRLQVSVVGEIPLETANKIANSIVFVTETR